MNDRRTRRAVLLLGAAIFLASALLSGTSTGWNVNSRAALVMAVVDHGEVTIDRYHETPPYDTNDKAVYDGHYYSDKTIGLAMLGVPVYAATKAAATAVGHTLDYADILYVLSRAVVSTSAAAAAMLMALLLIRLGAVPRRAVLATAGVFFGSLLFGYGTIFMPYLPGVAACLGALTIVLAAPLTLRRAIAVGLLLGSALVLDLTFVFAVVAVVAFMIRALWRDGWRPAVPLLVGTGAGAFVPLAAFFAYCYAIFGSLTIPYRYEYSDFFRESMGKGLMGATMPKLGAMWFLSFHPYRGVLFWSPWLLVAVACGVIAWRRDAHRSLRPFVVAAGLVFVAYFLFNAGYYLWWGGDGMGPRLMIPLFVFAPLVLVVACRPDAPRWLWPSLLTTMAVAAALCMPLAMVNPQTVEGNPMATLLHAGVGTHVEVPQFHVLRLVYTLHWDSFAVRGLRSLSLHWGLSLASMVGLTWAAWRAGAPGSEPGASAGETLGEDAQPQPQGLA